MTDDEIVKRYREALVNHYEEGEDTHLIIFARAIAAAEREACVKHVRHAFKDLFHDEFTIDDVVDAIRAGHVCGWNGATPASDVCPVCEAEAIRARSET